MGGHWYTADGEAQHYQPTKDGGSRNTTLRDARKLNLYPSVTGYLAQLAKPGLGRAAQNLIIQACSENPKLPEETDRDYATRIRQIAFVKWDEAREVGEEIHNDIECIFNGEEPKVHPDIANEAVGAICMYTKTPPKDFIPEKTVVGPGYGGMIDLHNDEYVIDWKTKDIGTAKLAYPEMCMQLAAYDKALDWKKMYPDPPPRKMVNVFVDRKEPGKVIIHEWPQEEADKAWEKFQLLVKYWQLDKGYVPGE